MFGGPSWWARKAWAWAVRRKITDGTSPDGYITRAQVATMLYRALVGPVQSEEAWMWAKSRGITDGTRPGDLATREEVVTMLYRALVGM